MYREHDHIGEETLERMKAVTRYNTWIYERIRPWLGDVVLEVGSGIGNFSDFFLDRKKLILTDVREDYLEQLKVKMADQPNVAVEYYDLESSGVHLANMGVDTIVALNVLEHIENDAFALLELQSILVPGGRVILQLPAHALLYGTLDKNIDHYRRYTKKDIRKKLVSAGLEPERFFRMNMPGAAGWFVYSRLLKREILPTGPLGLFNTLTPLFTAVERVAPIPFGLSLFAVARKPG